MTNRKDPGLNGYAYACMHGGKFSGCGIIDIILCRFDSGLTGLNCTEVEV